MLFLLFTNVRAPIHSLATHILVALDDTCHPHANHWLTYISMNVVGENVLTSPKFPKQVQEEIVVT